MKLALAVLWLLVLASSVWPYEATISWDPPTTNDDACTACNPTPVGRGCATPCVVHPATPLTDLGGYIVYWDTKPRTAGVLPPLGYANKIDVGNVTTWKHTAANPTIETTFYYAVTAYDTATPTRNESVFSNEVSKRFTPPDTRPPFPPAARIAGLQVAPTIFGDVKRGIPTYKVFYVANRLDRAIQVQSIMIDGDPVFSERNIFPMMIQPQKTALLGITFTPTEPGLYGGRALVNTTEGQVTILLSGMGI